MFPRRHERGWSATALLLACLMASFLVSWAASASCQSRTTVRDLALVETAEGTVHILPERDLEETARDEQRLTTVVQDPSNPEEPWEVTTYRRPDESMKMFVKRHGEMVKTVRDYLRGNWSTN